MSELYTSKRLNQHLTAIRDITGVRCILAEGERRALLIDTGVGIGDLAEFVTGLTTLPLTVWCTHGHMDHVGGASQFEKVYLPIKDFALAEICTVEVRMNYAKAVLKDQYNLSDGDYLPSRENGYLPLDDGTCLNLGQITAVAAAFPGHTQGMMTVLFPELRTVLLGDACNPRTFLFAPEATTVRTFRANAVSFKTRYWDVFDKVLMSHGADEYVDKAILPNCIALCDEIIAGKDEHIPILTRGRTAYLSRQEIRPGVRADGGVGNIAYNPEKI